MGVDSTAPPIGCHLLADFYGTDANILSDTGRLTAALVDAATAAGMTPVCRPAFFAFPPRESDLPGGVTAFLMLAESHIALHTYPEHGYMAADIFTCGLNPEDSARRAADSLGVAVAPRRVVLRTIARGEDIQKDETA